ncbi:hypothetical protein XENTR_v10010259 [Xenopus tropicalis]|nr:hypothetical protein XENTR_v10010259 [Xenopus tropicalis]
MSVRAQTVAGIRLAIRLGPPVGLIKGTNMPAHLFPTHRGRPYIIAASRLLGVASQGLYESIWQRHRAPGPNTTHCLALN